MKTGEVRLDWLFVLRRDKKNKQRVTVLIPKGDAATLAACAQAEEEALAKKWPNNRPPYYRRPLKDGDTWRNPSNNKPAPDEYKGHWFFTATAKNTKTARILDMYGNEITNPSSVKSGDYGRCTLIFYGSDKDNNLGVNVCLNNINFTRSGEALSVNDAGGAAEDEFAGDFQQPPAGYVPPARYTPPAQQAAPMAPPQQPAQAPQPVAGFAQPPAAPQYQQAPAPQQAAPQPPAPTMQLSPDGKWAWTGTAWVPNDTRDVQHINY